MAFRQSYIGLSIGAVCIWGLFGPSAASAGEPQAIEEIVVTATRRSQSLMDVPASITAFSDIRLEESKIQGIMDLNMHVPNWNTGQQNGQAMVSVRGIGMSQAQGVAEGAIAQHLDGVYQPRTTGLRGVYFDLESIEALRGPQGTLYGRNATGGALNIITKKPTETLEAQVGVLLGDYETTQMTGVISGPLTDNLLGRLSVLHSNREEGYTKNLLPGFDDVDDEEVTSGKIALRFLPTDTLTIDWLANYETRDGSLVFASLTPPRDVGFPMFGSAPFTLEPHKVVSDTNAYDERTDWQTVLTVDWDVSDRVSVKSITGYQENDWEQFFDGDGTGAFASTALYKIKSHTLSQELTSSFALLNDRLDVVAGAFLYEDSLDYSLFLPLNFLDDLLGLPPLTSVVATETHQKTTAFALFADATYHVADSFRVYGGVRGSYEEKEFKTELIQVVPACGYGTPPSELDDDWDDVSFRFGLQYDVSPRTMVYGQFQSGFRSGGFDVSSCADPYEPESVDAFEAGLKSTFADGTATVSATAFYYDYKDLQLQQIEGLQVNVTNAASSEVYGLELETSMLLGERWSIGLNYGYLHAQFKEFVDCDTLLFPGNCSQQALQSGMAVFEDLSGNPLTRAPEHSIGVSLDYSVPMSIGELDIRVDANWTDAVQHRQFDRAEDRQDAYALVNAFVTYRPSSAPNWLLRAFGKNLTDEKYINSVLAVDAGFYRLTDPWGAPRTWGVEVVYSLE